MEKAIIKVNGMTCTGCVASVERVLQALDGVGKVAVSLERAQATVEFDEARVKLTDLHAAIEDAGYDVA